MKTVKVLNSLADLGKAWGLSPKQERQPKPRKCFRCGGEMRHIEGTNVFVCAGTTKGKDGKEKQCTNRLIMGNGVSQNSAKKKVETTTKEV